MCVDNGDFEQEKGNSIKNQRKMLDIKKNQHPKWRISPMIEVHMETHTRTHTRIHTISVATGDINSRSEQQCKTILPS